MSTVKVVFRKWKDGTIDALMPYEVDVNYTVTCYSRIGQHCTADYGYVVGQTKLATNEEYSSLLKELESIGYTVEVIKKANRDLMADLWYEMKQDHAKMSY